ncbi:MAG: carbohydrate porin [Proteobacteria bacterium]|nr:carbohydrate porin [Pseudomonadota bacterium]
MSPTPSNGRPRGARTIVTIAAASLLASAQARAQADTPAGTQTAPPAAAADQAAPAAKDDFWTRDKLLGDLGGVRTNLEAHGLEIDLVETDEVWGNVSGGIQKGAVYDGQTLLTVKLDTEKAFGWHGGTFNVSAMNIRGRNLSTDNLLVLQTNSGINALATTRFWEIWYEQSFLDDKMSVKLGQQSIDNEFMTSTGSATFLNTMMGWPMIPSADLYAGGPAYPLSSLGIRLKAQPTDNLTLLTGVFQDNPPGGQFYNDSQLLGSTRWGGNFNLRTGALFISEAQYTINQPSDGQLAKPGESQGYPGTYKLGFWIDTAAFPSQQFDNGGVSLASPDSNGIPAYYRNNFSIYAVADQVVWRPQEGPQEVALFARIMGAPGDRNLINFSTNAGATLKAPLPNRDDDVFGVGFGFTTLSGGARNYDKAFNFYNGTFIPVRSSETFIEITYQFKATGWWTIQPDFQYFFTPGGGLQNPNNPSKSVGNAAVFGLRSVVTF